MESVCISIGFIVLSVEVVVDFPSRIACMHEILSSFTRYSSIIKYTQE